MKSSRLKISELFIILPSHSRQFCPNHLAIISQATFIEKMLQKFGMSESKSVSTPASADTKLVPSEGCSEECNQQLYQALVGSLLYLSTKTRSDIAYAVSRVAPFCAKPTREHWTTVKRIFRYLKGTSNLGLLYLQNQHFSQNGQIHRCRSARAGDIEDRKSISGYDFLLGGAAINWKSSKQSCVALSTAEAEYVALCAATQEQLHKPPFE